MSRNIKRIINELMADDRIQRMHRANIAKRQAARAARRAAMLARHNKHLPMAWDSVEAVAGDESEWLRLRCVEVIRRIEAKGYDWLDYLMDRGLLHRSDEFMELCEAQSEARHSFYSDKPREAYADRTEIDGVEVLHNTSYSAFLEMGQHWREEELKQSFENIADDDRATRIETAKRLAAEAAEHYRAAMAAMAA
ncbi:TPA: hypothetical protein LAN44_004854 [Escherichia coli]|nr:hypothetical protein [Escherichia coli]